VYRVAVDGTIAADTRASPSRRRELSGGRRAAEVSDRRSSSHQAPRMAESP
jgi:hypothetical protein